LFRWLSLKSSEPRGDESLSDSSCIESESFCDLELPERPLPAFMPESSWFVDELELTVLPADPELPLG
jgi:hypothetical protein